MKADLRNGPEIEAAVARFLLTRGQQLVTIEPEPLRQNRYTIDRLSVDAEAFTVVAKFDGGEVHTYHWAYEPMSRGASNAGLKRLISNRWIDAP
jgi:hypothetical protein